MNHANQFGHASVLWHDYMMCYAKLIGVTKRCPALENIHSVGLIKY
jgi:hypothetical protein